MTWLDGVLWALDTETTSVDPEEARVITCCIGQSPAAGTWLPQGWLINPGVPVGDSERVHGISDATAASGAEPAKALRSIRGVLVDAARLGQPIVGHNLAYDLTVLDREFRRHLTQPLPEGLVCLDTLVLFRRLDLSTGGRRLEDLAYRRGFRFPAHDATADALASLRLLHILAGDNDLLPFVPVADLQPLQARWHAAHQEAGAAKRRGNGQTVTAPSTDWPLKPYDPPRSQEGVQR